MKKKVAIVVQRYGNEVVGGAEGLAKELAEFMAQDWQITVLTSCAKDYTTWENFYPAGEHVINNVAVRRFAVEKPRDFDAFSRVAASIENTSFRLSPEEELDYFVKQGPYAPELVSYIEKAESEFDVFIFFTYLYYPTAIGLSKVAHKSYLLSTAHDEAPFYFVRTYAPLFHSLKGIIYLSEEEKQLINRVYKIPEQVAQIKGGYGVPLPKTYDAKEKQRMEEKFSYLIGVRYFLYLGRASATKCCQNLIDAYADMTGDYGLPSKLIFAGTMEKNVVFHDRRTDMINVGYVTEVEKSFLLKHASALVNPSPLESLSMVVLEAWQHGTPVIVNGQSEVMRGLCDRSGAGLYYYSRPMLKGLMAWAHTHHHDQNRALGHKGISFVRTHFNWQVVRERLLSSIQ